MMEMDDCFEASASPHPVDGRFREGREGWSLPLREGLHAQALPLRGNNVQAHVLILSLSLIQSMSASECLSLFLSLPPVPSTAAQCVRCGERVRQGQRVVAGRKVEVAETEEGQAGRQQKGRERQGSGKEEGCV